MKVFDFKKSVSYSWQNSKSYNGSWGASIWIGLPSPVSFIGLSLSISLEYSLILDSVGSVYSQNPYTYQVKLSANANLSTDSSATLKVGIFKGGVHLYGDLVKLNSELVSKA